MDLLVTVIGVQNMNSKILSFQIAQGYTGQHRSWTPDIVALCEDGSLWIMCLKEFQNCYGSWKKMTPDIKTQEQDLWDNGNGQLV